ncbi:MAG: phosphate acyltransferase PlsX, partial [Chloroflexi bacterium]|nr:phosphate acyltransferase PlsX [Chloroflexota bacterium]
MRIVLDAMGSDKYPGPEIEAAIQLARGGGVEIILVGNERVVKPGLDALKATDVNLPIVHAPEMVDMAEKPAAAARGKAENSMAVGMELVKRGEADAFVTAGNTGGALANALFHLGRIRGVNRPGIGAPFPVKGGSCVLIDIGANAECKPEYLLQFAIMGSLYAEKVFGVHRPRVGLLSNGEEAGKGNDLVKGTYPLLASSSLNFIGNVEGKEFFGGQADVVVTDGFTGNIVLKSAEAVAKLLTETIRDEIKSNPITAIGGRLAQPAFKRVRRVLDPSEQGAAPLLGVDGLVFIGHGRSDARALVNAVGTARRA